MAEHNVCLIRNTPLARLGGTQGHKMRSKSEPGSRGVLMLAALILAALKSNFLLD